MDLTSLTIDAARSAVQDCQTTALELIEAHYAHIHKEDGQTGAFLTLSKERAEAVKNYLVEKYGFPGSRMRTVGNGSNKPIDDNATPDGREKNRRTDIKVYPNPTAS